MTVTRGMLLSLRQAERNPLMQIEPDNRTKNRDSLLKKLWDSMKGPKARNPSNALKAAGFLIQSHYKILERK